MKSDIRPVKAFYKASDLLYGVLSGCLSGCRYHFSPPNPSQFLVCYTSININRGENEVFGICFFWNFVTLLYTVQLHTRWWKKSFPCKYKPWVLSASVKWKWLPWVGVYPWRCTIANLFFCMLCNLLDLEECHLSGLFCLLTMCGYSHSTWRLDFTLALSQGEESHKGQSSDPLSSREPVRLKNSVSSIGYVHL